MEDTSGFYKNDNGQLLFGKNYVLSGSYNLYREQKDQYSYPVGGWVWFDSEEQARAEFNIPIQEDTLPNLNFLNSPFGIQNPSILNPPN